MKGTVFTFLSIFFFVSLTFSQEILSENEMELKSGFNDRGESIPIINKETSELSLIVVDRKTVYFNKYDNAFKLIDRQKFEKPKSKAKNIRAAANSNSGEYLFLLSNDNNKKLELLSLNTKNKKTEVTATTFISKKELFLNTFTHQNQIYLITILPNTSKLNIRKIRGNNDIEILEYDLSKETFFDYNGDASSLHHAFLTPDGNSVSFNLETEHIKTNIPNSLSITSKLIKLYIRSNNTATISLDKGNKFTQLLSFNLDAADYTVEVIQKPTLSITRAYDAIRSNSYLSGNKLYQVINNNDQLKLTVTNIESKKVIKEIAFQKKDSITFKNGPIVWGGKIIDKYEEVEQTKKFLRNIASGNVGVSVYKKDSITAITIGGVLELEMYARVPAMTFGIAGSKGLGSVNSFTSPTYYAYTGYTKSKSTYLRCLFNPYWTHIPGEVPKNAFDKIKDFSEEQVNQKAETLFKFNNHYIYGYYNPASKKYLLRKFED